MFHKQRKQKLCLDPLPETQFKPSQKVVNGIVRKALEVSTISPADRMKSLRASDYELSNVLSIGATDMLRPCKLNRDDLEHDAANVESFEASVVAASQKPAPTASNSSDPANIPSSD